MDGIERCHHFCNEPLRCPECVRRFWKWAENHTRGRKPKGAKEGPSFYEAAASNRRGEEG